jgi:elongation factor 2 kinase
MRVMLNADTEHRRHLVTASGLSNDSYLGKVHLEMCRYHEFGRFVADESEEAIDYAAAFFHLTHAANLGVTDALVSVAKIHMQLPHDILPEYKIEESDDNYKTGFEFMIDAAEKDEKSCLYFVAKAFDTGIGLPKD